jgi:ATP-dependent Clp protease adaptor protein ClpS
MRNPPEICYIDSMNKVFSMSAANESLSGGVAVLDKPSDVERKPSPRYRVLLHNDPHNFPQDVIQWLMEVVNTLDEEMCVAIMLEAHTTGVGLVVTCDQEMAEFYVEQLKRKGLTMSMEPEE